MADGSDVFESHHTVLNTLTPSSRTQLVLTPGVVARLMACTTVVSSRNAPKSLATQNTKHEHHPTWRGREDRTGTPVLATQRHTTAHHDTTAQQGTAQH